MDVSQSMASQAGRRTALPLLLTCKLSVFRTHMQYCSSCQFGSAVWVALLFGSSMQLIAPAVILLQSQYLQMCRASVGPSSPSAPESAQSHVPTAVHKRFSGS